ncbi:sugar ABC transporter permease [Paenibacillus marchantiophytorum]|uniref:Sugar ABC transporter permease n=1 Tax=Paenibacillus marchantiophytorum TaxID=1619310 RepID=A0ABQ2BS71_9BACL|nr:sugar ABC transporter permease [Paenibacillus marchantiophytorum]GGI46371.1 sugar ABC transporter permease [Paenibacillus marchantiophytorum]
MLKFKREHVRRFEFGMFILPAIITILFAFYIPFIMSMLYSLTQWNGISSQPKFIGLDNFKSIFISDDHFKQSIIFTLKFSFLYILCVNALSLIVALALDQKLRTTNLLRAAFFVPYILSLVIVGFIWRFILNQGFDTLAEFTGIGFFKLSWLGVPNLAFISIIIVSVWQSIGFYIVIYIAGLQAVPRELLESSIIDGAGPFQRFFNVTLPLLAPSVTVCMFMSMTNAIKVFDVILSLTGGGPGGSTYSVALDIYRDTFQNNMYGYGSAKALVLFVVVLLITILQLTYFKRREVEH